jgi:hypothetical protein
MTKKKEKPYLTLCMMAIAADIRFFNYLAKLYGGYCTYTWTLCRINSNPNVKYKFQAVKNKSITVLNEEGDFKIPRF